jgi:prolyl-tRNA synthetase
MLYSKLFGKSVKTVPSDTKLISHKFLVKGGFILQTAAGLYSFLPLGYKVLSKIHHLVEEELEKQGVQNLLMPVVTPASLWQESGRYQKMDDIMGKFFSKRGQELIISPTHEEISVDLARHFIRSYRDLPVTINHIQTKFRDEIRVFGGLIRTREFIMQDAYSFDRDKKGLDESFRKVVKAYENIFSRVGVDAVEVEADSGTMGGSDSHEFMAMTGIGEDKVLQCKSCGYIANVEKAEFEREEKNPKEKVKPLKIIDQPEWVYTMDDNVKHYGEPLWKYLKNVVYKDEKGKIFIASIRGDQDVNEAKLKAALGKSFLEPATEEDLKKMGTQHGYVHSWGESGNYIGDLGLKTVKNFIGGQKTKTTDSINVNYGREFNYPLADIVEAKEGDICTKCKKGKLLVKRGIEIGHAFKLGTCYSESMGIGYLDEKGKTQVIQMGSYGIGTTRLMAAIVEMNNDENGIIWPESVAPFKYHLLGLDLQDKNVKTQAEKVYKALKDNGEEVLYDDREDITPGEKFKDADLLGMPYRLVVSKKTEDKIEIKERNKKEQKLVTLESLLKK